LKEAASREGHEPAFSPLHKNLMQGFCDGALTLTVSDR